MTVAQIARRFRLPRRRAAGGDVDLVGPTASSSSCPRCSRPLRIRDVRCSGCGSYLVAGTLLRTAIVLLVVGVAVGGTGFAALSGVLTAARAPLPVVTAQPAAPAAGFVGPRPPLVVAPPAVRAGLVQASAINERLARSAAALRTAVSSQTAADIATILRKISADTTSGEQVVRRLATWPETAALGERLIALYGNLGTAAEAGLAHALSDRAAYRAQGSAMLKSLRALDGAAAATSDAAAANGLHLPGSSATP